MKLFGRNIRAPVNNFIFWVRFDHLLWVRPFRGCRCGREKKSIEQVSGTLQLDLQWRYAEHNLAAPCRDALEWTSLKRKSQTGRLAPRYWNMNHGIHLELQKIIRLAATKLHTEFNRLFRRG